MFSKPSSSEVYMARILALQTFMILWRTFDHFCFVLAAFVFDPSQRIVGGTDAKVGQFKYQVNML